MSEGSEHSNKPAGFGGLGDVQRIPRTPDGYSGYIVDPQFGFCAAVITMDAHPPT